MPNDLQQTLDLKSMLILVCAGTHATQARKSGYPLLHLGLGLSPTGGLTRHTLSAQSPDGYLGISDFGLTSTVPQTVLMQVLQQARQIYAKGIFADFEHPTDAVRNTLTRLDTLCAAQQMPLFIPLAQADYAPNAQLVFETAISGGSLATYLGDLRHAHGNRLVASLRTIRQHFTLPSPDSEGEALTADQLTALQSRYDAQSFYSAELCARYFTYMEGDAAHFVLYDDPSTVTAKLRLLSQLGISTVFACYEDVAHLL